MEADTISRKEAVMSLQLLRRLSVGLGCLSLLSILVAHLALTDIYHGEADTTLEWRALQAAAAVIVTFHVAALAALVKFGHRRT